MLMKNSHTNVLALFKCDKIVCGKVLMASSTHYRACKQTQGDPEQLEPFTRVPLLQFCQMIL